ncbi:MAG: hypothetical protein Q4A15_09480 [Prevotellaceae bacterium]|nr:hypothetical protein [Prevotellaceae bacterium]
MMNPQKIGNNSLLLKCPDDHHPHAIDLGLPSGTKWCCCNVGATTPEGYGGYYAWGETSEKDMYNSDTYAYFYNGRIYLDIGSDIACTQYDVAYVLMGGSWRMPSLGQQVELMDNCTRTWTNQNGVEGILVTGKNGGQIFLPAAGFLVDADLYYEGCYGSYWSSSHEGLCDELACYFDFGTGFGGFWNWDVTDRSIGQPVRAVCP